MGVDSAQNPTLIQVKYIITVNLCMVLIICINNYYRKVIKVALFELLVCPHDSWYRGRVETLDAKYNLVAVSVVEPWFHSWYKGKPYLYTKNETMAPLHVLRVETLDANS